MARRIDVHAAQQALEALALARHELASLGRTGRITDSIDTAAAALAAATGQPVATGPDGTEPEPDADADAVSRSRA